MSRIKANSLSDIESIDSEDETSKQSSSSDMAEPISRVLTASKIASAVSGEE